MKNILIPTDFSANSRRAAEYAILLFHQNDTNLYLMNSYEMPQAGASMLISMEDILKKNSEEELCSLEIDLKQDFSGHKPNLKTISIYGDPVFAVSKVVEDNKIDLIIMGTQGASGLKEKLIGSNTASVVKKANCSVLVVPEKSPLNVPKRILLAIDPANFDANAILPLQKIAKTFQSTIHLLYVASENTKISDNDLLLLTKLDKQLNGIKIVPKVLISTNPVESIDAYAEQIEANMVVMLPRKTNFFESLFFKSHSKKMAMHTNIPLLTLPI
jgi:nucleotide-binding universal stress UspA family protein